jgi:dGTPase
MSVLEPLLREELEAREDGWLAPYAMRSGRSAGRAHPLPAHPFRSNFQRDRERVIHSRAFRRLKYKTQVFVATEGDYYRTRLTHTLEAAQIARSVARVLRLNEDLTEAIALAHDLGHPPFGHAGERALAHLTRDHGGFEHNAQALRTVDLLERRYAGHRGLNLSREVREGVWKRRNSEMAKGLGYAAEFDATLGPLLEAQVADAADGIAYDHADLDDALKSGLIRVPDLVGMRCWDEATAEVEEQLVALGDSADRAERVRCQVVVRHLLAKQVDDLVTTTTSRLRAAGIATIDDVRSHDPSSPLVTLSPAEAERKDELQAFLKRKVYRHWRVMRHVEKAGRFLGAMFEEFVAHPRLLPPEYQAWVEVAGLQRGVCDYLAGMTDRYAQREYLKLFQPFEPM